MLHFAWIETALPESLVLREDLRLLCLSHWCLQGVFIHSLLHAAVCTLWQGCAVRAHGLQHSTGVQQGYAAQSSC